MRRLLVILLTLLPHLAWGVYDLPASRKVDWSKAGATITNRTTIYATLAAGSTATQIQNAINNCPSGQVVKLGTGTFNLGTSSLTMKSGVTLRGDGPGNTKLYSTATGGYKDATIKMYGGYDWFPGPSSSQYKIVASDVAQGATTITLPNVTGLAVGDVVSISQLNDIYNSLTNQTGLVNLGSSGQGCSYCGVGAAGERLQQELTAITNINGNVITVDPPITVPYKASKTIWVVRLGTLTDAAGVEDLYIENTASTPYYALFAMVFTKRSWLKNVEGKKAMNRFVLMYGGFKNTIRDSYFHDSYGNGGSGADTDNGSDHGYGIGVEWFSSWNLIENNKFDRMHLAVAMDTGPGAGNVVSYNIVTNQKYKDNNFLQHDFLMHSALPHMNLFEGNMGFGATNDNIHLGHAYNVWFRNWFRNVNGTELSTFRGNTVSGYVYTTNSDLGTYYVSWVGNVLGYSGITGMYEYIYQDPAVTGLRAKTSDSSFTTKAAFKTAYNGSNSTTGYDAHVWDTELRHQNYNYFTNTTRACDTLYEPGCQGGSNDTQLPASLYLTSKPAFLGNSPWPPIGPDVVGYAPSTLSWGTAVAPDTTPPTMTAFTIPATSTTLTFPVNALSATDNVGVVAYCVNIVNSTSNCNWTVAPATLTVSGSGTYNYYAFARDAAGNNSTPLSQTVTVTLVIDTTKPVVTSFSIPATSVSLSLPINSLTATDNVGVTGYCVSETNNAATCVWYSSVPFTYTFASGGNKTLYAFAKDAAGNTSTSLFGTITVTDNTLPYGVFRAPGAYKINY